MNEFAKNINRPDLGFFGVNFVFKTLFFIVVLFYVLYSFLMLLRVRILSDTVETPYNRIVQLIVLGNLILALVGGFLAMMLILPA